MPIARIRGAHGIRGELKVETFDPRSGAIRKGVQVWLGVEKAPRRVVAARRHGPALLVTVEGASTRNDAEALLGQEITIERTALPELEEGEFYLSEVVGYKVSTLSGEDVGEVEGFVAGGAQEILRIRGAGLRAGKELLVPAVEGILVEVRHPDQQILIDPPEGLLDL